jgi:hypothetical protein
MIPSSGCPERQVLERFLLGHISGDEGDRLSDHLQHCARCCEVVTALQSEDTLVQALRGVEHFVQEAGDDVVEGLRRKLKSLPPPVLGTALESLMAGRASGESSPNAAEELTDFLAPPGGPGEIGRLGPYRLLKVLGAGGMGIVFEAVDPQLQRRVAVKVLKPALAASAAARRRFLREAQATAACAHDHIVAVHQVGEDRGIPFLVMPLLEGETLQMRLAREGQLRVAEVLRIGREAAEGLAADHQAGLIHRDINPANLWLEGAGGRVKIMDFGLARAAEYGDGLTQPGTAMGTPPYIAPEQARGIAWRRGGRRSAAPTRPAC